MGQEFADEPSGRGRGGEVRAVRAGEKAFCGNRGGGAGAGREPPVPPGLRCFAV